MCVCVRTEKLLFLSQTCHIDFFMPQLVSPKSHVGFLLGLINSFFGGKKIEEEAHVELFVYVNLSTSSSLASFSSLYR